MLLIQTAPLLVLVVLLGVARTGPVAACLATIAASLPAFLATQDASALAGFVAASTTQGAWLAVVPVGIVAAGLVFHGAVMSRDQATIAPGTTGETAFTAAFLLGPFTETVTGFCVGAIFALGVMRRAGVAGVPAAAMALLTLALIPWGGLGPGTAVGAALSGVPAQELATRNAWIVAAELPLLLGLFWHWSAAAGFAVPAVRRVAQFGWVAAVGTSLILWHRVAPWELCGVLATGPLLALRLLMADPPRSAAAWLRALRIALPYLFLAGVLLASRLWHDAPAVRPFANLPGLAANHAMVAIILVAAVVALAQARPGRVIGDALARAWRPALALLMFVVLSRFLSNAGIPQALAQALAEAFGQAAPYGAPLLAGISAFFAGTNVGSNSTMMPLQMALGQLAGMDQVALPAIQNGTLFLLLAPQVVGMVAGLAGRDVVPAAIWRMAWPVAPIAIAVGLAAVAIG
ncbi:MAG: L-lactate permease [Acetobacteraceae bacterium]|nr:L-lactate permease [Acetobacteraceae bacterium]